MKPTVANTISLTAMHGTCAMRCQMPRLSDLRNTHEKEDKNTQAVFGNYVDIYDIQQAVEDGVTVKIYYESRLAKIVLSEEDQKILDERVEEITERKN
jgi:hypothetical protein